MVGLRFSVRVRKVNQAQGTSYTDMFKSLFLQLLYDPATRVLIGITNRLSRSFDVASVSTMGI